MGLIKFDMGDDALMYCFGQTSPLRYSLYMSN